jgi:hypothetical protein
VLPSAKHRTTGSLINLASSARTRFSILTVHHPFVAHAAPNSATWKRRPPWGGAFRRVHEARLGGQQQFYLDLFPKDMPMALETTPTGRRGAGFPQTDAARRATFAHVAPPAPSATYVATRWLGLPPRPIALGPTDR